ncbi:Something about silencing protein 10 [Frankliniella fusca]|uniref:Something about silencing protein 10 n=1 Tax=Frankliniella fusca TaxID=407009 RepID=A0AAE1LHV2_9NEOP|nr:Something about silencing protein 10 [Frankliniella fusca]
MKHSKKRGSNSFTQRSIQEDMFLDKSSPYEPSDSEDDYSQQEKMLLEKVRSKSAQNKTNKKVAVMDLPLYDEDEEDVDEDDEDIDDEEDDDVNMDSDIEGKDDDFHLPDQRAWGKTKKNYYNTDYVDKDYGGFDGEDAAAAELEEQEAREIQKRLAAELDDNDFTLDVFTKSKEEDQATLTPSEEIIKTDLSKLSSKQKLALLEKEAPELIGIISEFRDLMEELQTRLQPAINLVQKKLVSSPHLIHFIRTKYHLVNNYAMNVCFYLLLRARRLPVAAHPVVKRLLQFRQLLQQLQPLEIIASDQLDELLSAAKNGLLPINNENGSVFKKKPKNSLKLLSLSKPFEEDQLNAGFEKIPVENSKVKKSKAKETTKSDLSNSDKPSGNYSKDKESGMPWENSLDIEKGKGVSWNSSLGSGSDSENDNDNLNDEMVDSETLNEDGSKRAITWQMAKNKGLTPHRKKEQRNPRVKHRNKFRKAKIRRKGQVREARTELKRYGGEMSGIKKTVTKSIKLK